MREVVVAEKIKAPGMDRVAADPKNVKVTDKKAAGA